MLLFAFILVLKYANIANYRIVLHARYLYSLVPTRRGVGIDGGRGWNNPQNLISGGAGINEGLEN